MAKGDANKSQSSNVKVVVRVRPTNRQEREKECKIVVKAIDDYMLVFDPKTDSEAKRYGGGPRRPQRTALDRRHKDLRFAFDRVFNEDATNQEVFEFTTYSVVDSLLQGYNCSVFAYGATSAGKTHTMLGSPTQPGVIFLTMMELYKKIYEKTDEFTCDVSVSYLEIYNENARDLLNPSSTPLAVREDPQKGVCVSGLSLHKPQNAEELFGMLEFGNQNRTQHPTDANKQSSRSHAVFQVFVRQQPKGSGLSTDVKVAKMSLIDLAGSERATVTTNRGARFREGANINRSLLALGNCINALADNKPMKGKKEVHIPYRDSKLTRLLKDSLGGNCKTIMIAAVSPSSTCFEDTYNTLKYADRAKNIKSELKSNVISVDFHVSKYAKIVDELKQQVEELKNKVKRYENGDATPMKQQRLIFTQNEQLRVIQDELYSVYKDRCLIRKHIIDCEATEKELKIKLFQKERTFERIQLLLEDKNPSIAQFSEKLEKFKMATTAKQCQIRTKSQTFVRQLAENEDKISTVKSRADEWLSSLVDASLKEHFIHFHEARVSDVEKVSAKAQTRHLKRYALLQEKDNHATERLVSKLLRLVKKQFNKLREADSVSIDIEQDFAAVMEDLEGGKRIIWADESSRENLDVASLINFTSCTPVRTPARTRNILMSNTPQRIADDVYDDGKEESTALITAKNSYFNSRAGMQAGEAEFHRSLADATSDDNAFELREVEVTSRASDKVEQMSVESTWLKDPRDGLKRQAESDESMVSPSKRRTTALSRDLKMPQFDPVMLPQVPSTEPSIDPPTNQGQKPLASVEAYDKDRRGTIILQKAPEEVKNLPLVDAMAADTVRSGTELKSSVDNCDVDDDENDDENDDANDDANDDENGNVDDDEEVFDIVSEGKVAQDLGQEHLSEKPSNPLLNATFDVTPFNEKEGNLDSEPPEHDVSGVEPIVQTPDRQPLSVLCENKLKGEMTSSSSTAATLKQNGLPSMRSGSNLKVGKSPKTGIESIKNDHNKLLNSSSKFSSAKSKYASITSRLYEENPRYTANNSVLKARQKTEKRRRSNTLTNPIRLRDSRRRSRSSTASNPYNLQASRKNLPSHILGVRRAIEQMGALKGTKRNFAPVTSSAVMKPMSSSVL